MFQDRKFPVLLASEALSLIGDRILAVALVVLVYDLTGSAATVSILMMLKAVPALFLGTVAGALVDRMNRKYVMVAANLAQGTLVLMIPFTDTLLTVYALYFLMSVVNQFFIPARAATLPSIVPAESLMAANALFSIAFVGAIALGPMIGGLLIEASGTDAAFFADSISFLIPAIAVALLALPRSAPRSEKRGFMDELKTGLGYIRETKPVQQALMLAAMVYMGIGAISVLGIVIADKVLGTGAGGYGLMMSSMGVGMLIGAVLTGRFGKRADRITLAAAGAILSGSAISALPFVGNLMLAFGVNMALGMGMVAVQTSANTLFQTAPEALRGRVMGVAQSLMGAASFMAMGLAGILAEWIGITPVLGLIGGATAATGGRVLQNRRRAIAGTAA